jgi:hypothetical protein
MTEPDANVKGGESNSRDYALDKQLAFGRCFDEEQRYLILECKAGFFFKDVGFLQKNFRPGRRFALEARRIGGKHLTGAELAQP